LLLLHNEGERQVLIVLANTETGLAHAIERLTVGTLDDCLLRETETPTPTILALCPTGEVIAGDGGGGWEGPEPIPPPPTPTPTVTETGTITNDIETVTETVEPPETAGSIMVVAVDEGEGQYDSMTSLDDYVDILQGHYDVETWSLAQDGPPPGPDFLDYDLVIWTFGDFDTDESLENIADALVSILMAEIPFVMSGAYVGDTSAQAVQRDLQVGDSTHPITEGFAPEEVIGFVLPPSGSEYEISVVEEVEEGEGAIVFVRGPDSEEAGAPSIVVAEDEMSGLRAAIVGFPLYLLPEEARSSITLNIVGWLLSP
jgi:hypothetical protein